MADTEQDQEEGPRLVSGGLPRLLDPNQYAPPRDLISEAWESDLTARADPTVPQPQSGSPRVDPWPEEYTLDPAETAAIAAEEATRLEQAFESQSASIALKGTTAGSPLEVVEVIHPSAGFSQEPGGATQEPPPAIPQRTSPNTARDALGADDLAAEQEYNLAAIEQPFGPSMTDPESIATIREVVDMQVAAMTRTGYVALTVYMSPVLIDAIDRVEHAKHPGNRLIIHGGNEWALNLPHGRIVMETLVGTLQVLQDQYCGMRPIVLPQGAQIIAPLR